MSTKIPLPFTFKDHVKWGNWKFERGESGWKPLVDVVDLGKVLIVEMDLPGLDREDIELSIEDNILSITGQRSPREGSIHEVIQERGFGRFQRVITLPGNIESERAEAHLANGVLRIMIPKQGEISLEAHVVNGPKTEMDRNYEAYLRDKSHLEANFAGHVVAYFNGQRIAEGTDAHDLLKKIPEQYRRTSLFIKDVPSSPVIFRRPFFMSGEEA